MVSVAAYGSTKVLFTELLPAAEAVSRISNTPGALHRAAPRFWQQPIQPLRRSGSGPFLGLCARMRVCVRCCAPYQRSDARPALSRRLRGRARLAMSRLSMGDLACRGGFASVWASQEASGLVLVSPAPPHPPPSLLCCLRACVRRACVWRHPATNRLPHLPSPLAAHRLRRGRVPLLSSRDPRPTRLPIPRPPPTSASPSPFSPVPLGLSPPSPVCPPASQLLIYGPEKPQQCCSSLTRRLAHPRPGLYLAGLSEL